MNLNAVAQSMTRAITPPVAAILKVSTGWTKNADYSRMPTFADFPVTIDVQALSGEMLRQMDALNIGGLLRTAYFNGLIEGLDRPAGKGGDLITFTSGMFNGTTWLVVQPAENWDTAGWVRVIIQLQTGPNAASGSAAGSSTAAVDS